MLLLVKPVKLATTLPVTSCPSEIETFCSGLKCLKTYLHSTMIQGIINHEAFSRKPQIDYKECHKEKHVPHEELILIPFTQI